MVNPIRALIDELDIRLCPWKGSVRKLETWRHVEYKAEDGKIYHGAFELSELEATGGAGVYNQQGAMEVIDKSVLCLVAFPFVVAFRVVHTVVRVVPEILFTIGHFFYALYVRDPTKESRFDVVRDHVGKLVHIPIRMVTDLIRMPWYAFMYFLAHLYVIFDSSGGALNGRKMAAAVEQAWNRDAPLQNVCACFFVPLGNWSWQNIRCARKWNIGQMSGSGYVLARCYHPWARVLRKSDGTFKLVSLEDAQKEYDLRSVARQRSPQSVGAS